jgi:hypothetical protein
MNRQLEPGLQPSKESALGRTQIIKEEHLHAELWFSLASLLRSYTAVHGLHENRQAAIEARDEQIVASYGEKSLSLRREGAIVTWTRENGTGGRMTLSKSGRLQNETQEEEMDLTAEAWARELMR